LAVLIIGLTIIISQAADLSERTPKTFMVLSCLMVTYLWIVMICVAHRTYNPRMEPQSIRMIKIIVLLFCIIFCYASVYQAIFSLDNNAFSGNLLAITKDTTSLEDYGDFCYFSGVTLFTIGYGDISPNSKLSRGFAISEMITSFLLLSIMFSRSEL